MTTEMPTNILVVDDLPEKLLVYRTILDELGLNLVMATSGEEALRAVLNNDFAVILLDVNMPGMSGLETAAMIRKRRRSAHTPIIFVTAFADEMRASEGYAQGAVDYITTPIVPSILRAKVRVFADLYQMTQQVRKQAEERIALAEERSKREAAEEANRRLGVLALAGEVLGKSLDRDPTMRDIVRLALPVLADIAVLVTLQPDGQPGRTLWTRVESSGPVLHDVPSWANVNPEDDALTGAIELVLAGQSSLLTPGPVVALSLRTQGDPFAILGLSRRPSGRTFTPADITVADAFASRAAIAMENARLYYELQSADRQKNEFLSMLAHELRNPLAPMRSACEILREKASDPARVGWAHRMMDRQLTHMVRLVDDLLDVSRITLGKIRLVTGLVDLDVVVNEAIEAVRPLIDQAHHKLEVHLPAMPVPMLGDKARLIQILTNLLNNAAKYTDPGGRITLTASLTPTKTEPGNRPYPAMVRIRIKDTGIGIPPELVSKVFDLFTQANRSLDRSQGGLGVGLTLVRRLVEMHGGCVECRSDGPGQGSEFIVDLPLAEDMRPAERTPELELPQLNGTLRVAVIDDNVDGADSMATLLELLGHEVKVANDGPTGISLVREFDPDLVLLDIGLPGMDGYEVAQRLRREPRHRAMLVAVSGYGREDDRQRSREAGFSQHFVKPLEFEALKGLLDSLGATRRR